jgi:hypothetical protein
MKTAIVTLATGEHWKGAKVLFHTLEKHGLSDSIDRIAMDCSPPGQCTFAKVIRVTKDYSCVPVNAVNFPNVAPKLFALSLPYDRIIIVDCDMFCIQNCSFLWSNKIGALPF